MKTIQHFFHTHLIAFSLAALGLLGIAGTAVASAPAAAAAPSASSCGTNLSCIKTAGDKLISDRLEALSKLHDTAADNKGITDPQRDIIYQDVTTNKNGLTALQQKLDAETDVKAARADIKNIFEQFRIFAVVLPRDYGESELFHEQNMVARMTAENGKLTDLINKAKAKGDDVTKLLALQADYNAKLADATTQDSNAQGLIPSLTPANYPGTDGTLKTYRADLKAAHDDIKDAASDLHQMLQILQQDLGSK
jgi:hypothetical protein